MLPPMARRPTVGGVAVGGVAVGGVAVGGVRWWVPTAAMTLLSFLSYVDRNVLALLSTTILKEVGLTAEQYGWIISAFSAAYLVGNPVWGLVLDRFGVRVGLAVAAALWTCASVSHAFAATAVGFAVARAALGFGEGATFPGGLRTAAQTLRPDQRSRGVALAYSGGSLGAVLTPIIVTPIALRWGWRGAFVCTGLFGSAWLALWALVSRDARLKKAPRPAPGATRRLDRSVWGFMAAYGFGGLPLGFVLYGAPLYLGRHLGFDQAAIGHVLWIPPLGWETGYFFFGWVVDRAARRGQPMLPLFGRLFALLSGVALPLALVPGVASPAAALGLMFLAMFVSAGFVILSLADTTRRHADDQAALLAGLGAGAWSGLMTVVMPIFGRLFDRREFSAAFAIAALSPCIGWLAWRVSTRGTTDAMVLEGIARDANATVRDGLSEGDAPRPRPTE
jgi:ACS family hexuronate transporter-like MFS transporter